MSRRGGEVVHHVGGAGWVPSPVGLRVGGDRIHGRRGERLEVPERELRVAVAGPHDLALLGQLEPPGDGASRLGCDRKLQLPPAAADRTAAAMEQRQLDCLPDRHGGEIRLGPAQQPVRGNEPDLLVGVGVAEHHLLPIAPPAEVLAVALVAQERVERRPGGRQRLGRLEERDDVERELVADTRQCREVEDVRDVARRGRERDDVARDRAGAEIPLDARHRAECLEHLGTGGRAVAVGASKGAAMDRRVLAHLELGEVEAEGLDLPREVVDVAPGGSRQPNLDEPGLDVHQLGKQRVWTGVAVGAGPRAAAWPLAGEPLSRQAEALRDEPERLAEWLVGESLPERPGELRHRLCFGLEAPPERGWHGRFAHLGRDGLHQPDRDGLVAAEHVVGLDSYRLLGDR